MKKILLATTLALSVTSAFAADQTAILKVEGLLTNGACTPVLSDGGTVDYGTINLATLNATEVNQIGQKDINLTINCTSPTKVGFTVVDDKSSTNAGLTVENGRFGGCTAQGTSATFGVGLTTDNVKIGTYAVYIKEDSIVVDSNTVSSIYHDAEQGGAWQDNTNGRIASLSDTVYAPATTGTLEPLPFTNATFPLVTSLAIQDTSTLAITDDTPLSGQATISLVYL
ncbi:DUF1120 domain-containing protein [Citrobacter werkmanii]|uniref:DUF1120 domain-containing protein n=1 Tax=Citrobacter werkmanii TaxID=67827 RepID=UPI00271B760F|nr:DUF1120 domain-containing protein [Citrobacter werkmanii]MDO8232211.1 DUF1120 domain-containing protein [Citrobacter werkmanii]